MSLTQMIKREAKTLGFEAVGVALIADASPSTFFHRLQEWLTRQYHGSMAWMSREPGRRADPRLVLAGCRSILCLGMNYDTGHRPVEKEGYGRVARYAWGKDYHIVFKERLEQLESRIKVLAPEAKTKIYVDTGPVMEKAWAQLAGLGWIGKHSNLVSADYGSWLVLGEILTTLELSPDEPASDLCGSCRLCIQACPTSAIVEPFVVDARRCISYLTIEHRGAGDTIPEDLRMRMGNHIFGCDDCLDVCPYNPAPGASVDAAFLPSSDTLAPRLESLATLTESAFADRFRLSPIRRAKREGLLRNVTLAQTNEVRSTKVQSPLPSSAK
ncbi:MAG TPA: tRNA epoxyqueuosine(34) reductase QueG [Nitrospira sp.]